ncbi:MAG: hypothetical protein HQ508_08955 [Candidatus Marinimicrobia bacterium]|nr:hypothetical protein [Candidatus Neomarinimicrobiota bacterium]
MKDFNFFIFARVLHIIGVVLWIGGVAFVTTVLIPALRRMPDQKKRYELFEELEGRFSFQAKIATAITGLSGFYMLSFLDAWGRYFDVSFWWIHLMTAVWVIFTIVLFILEPLFLHKWFRDKAKINSNRTFQVLHTLHKVLLGLSLISILGAVAGVRGYQYFFR